MIENRRRKVAVFDVDGTIFRSSLFIEITEALISKGIFKKSFRKSYEGRYAKWLNRTGSYDDYLMSMVASFNKSLKGVRQSDFLTISAEVLTAKQGRVYRYTRKLIKDLKKKNYFLIAISQSPKIILDPFCKKLGFDKVYGRVYEVGKSGRFTGEVLYLDQISNKGIILKRALEKNNLTLRGSIVVGDSEGDIEALRLADHPICFNPNRKLYDYAKKKGWKVVVERKDVIYTLK